MNAERGRQYQDSVFRMYFNDEARLRELAGALHGKMYSPGERLEIVTLDGTFLTQVKNDISFLLAGHYLRDIIWSFLNIRARRMIICRCVAFTTYANSCARILPQKIFMRKSGFGFLPRNFMYSIRVRQMPPRNMK